MALLHTHNGKPHIHHSKTKYALFFSIGLVFLFALIEALSGWAAHSITLISDAGHMAADGLSLLLAALAGWIASKPPSLKHSYGLGRAEVLGAWFSSILMGIVAIFILIEAFERLRNPTPIYSPLVMLIAFIGMLINIFLAWILSHAEHTLNLRAAILHVLGDLLGSAAAFISGLVIYFTQWLTIDPLLSIFISILILISSFKLLKETLFVLMESVPLHLDLKAVKKHMVEVDKVNAINDLHIWTLSSGWIALSAHVEIDDFRDWGMVLPQLRELLANNYAIHHITLQPENRKLI